MAHPQYRVVVNGVETIMALSDEDVKAFPDAERVADADDVRTASEERQSKSDSGSARTKKAPEPANKSTES